MQKADHPDFWQSALRSLARRAQSEEMLSAKLKFKGASDASVKQVIAKAKKYQLLDDKAYALMLAEREKGKGRGPLRIMQNLKFHGIKDEAGREALTAVRLTEKQDVLEHAAVALKKKLLKNLNMKTSEKYRYLMTQGFAPDVCYKTAGAAGENLQGDIYE